MKKSLTKLLIIAIVCAILSFILCFFFTIEKVSEYGFNITQRVANEINEAGSDTPRNWRISFNRRADLQF